MFGLLEQVPKARRDRRPVEQAVIGGMRFAHTQTVIGGNTPKWMAVRRCGMAARLLRRCGVSRVVLPDAFAYTDILQSRGVRPVDTLPMYRDFSPELVRYAMREQHLQAASAVIAVVGERLSSELTRAVTALCLQNRYVQLDVPYGGENLARSLRRSLGVPLVTAASRKQLEQADVLILFAERPQLACQNPVVLPLYSESLLPPWPDALLPQSLLEELPAWCNRTQLLAALWHTGALKKSALQSGV